MSESSKLVPDTESVGDKLRDSLDLKEAKPDIGNPDVGSPVTPLQTRSSGRTSAAITTTSSSCSSSSSGSDRAVQTPVTRKHDSSQSTISSAAQTTSSNPAGPQLKSSSASAAQSLKTTAQSPKSTTLPSPKSTAVPSPKSTAPSSAAQSKSNTPSGTKSSKSTTPSAAKSGSSSSSPKAATGNQKPGRGSSSSDSTSGAAKSSCKSSPAPQQPIKIVPAGNLFPSGNVQITGMTQGNITTKCMDPKPGEKIYGYGSIIRGNIPSRAKPTASVSSPVIAGNSAGGSDADTLWKTVMSSSNPEEVTKLGNEMFKKDRFIEALKLCDRAVELSPTNATYHNNRATLLSALGRIGEAVIEFEEAIKLDPKFVRAHHNFAALLLRLGQVDDAGMHLFSVEDPSDPTVVTMLELVDEHLSKCTDARSRCEWNIVLTEANAAMESGADSSPQLGMCKVEALLKLLRLDDAQTVLASVPKIESLPDSFSQTRFFNMIGEAYVSFVKSHLELALGRFENAVTAAEKASIIDSKNNEVETWYRDVKLITRARDRGNNLYESERYTEAMSAYTEGLKIDPSNATLFCHRADCFFKVGMWESSIEDYNHALLILPSYTKPRLQRAASYIKLENWAEAVKDYETLRMEMPYDEEIAESLFQAQVELKKSRGEVVEEISSLEELKTALNRPGVSFVYFYRTSDEQCKQLCVFMDALSIRYPSLHFLKVEIEKYLAVGDAERVGFEPTFKIYKHGARRMEIVCPCQEMLENSVIQYNR